jgi:hypothetical protein
VRQLIFAYLPHASPIFLGGGSGLPRGPAIRPSVRCLPLTLRTRCDHLHRHHAHDQEESARRAPRARLVCSKSVLFACLSIGSPSSYRPRYSPTARAQPFLCPAVAPTIDQNFIGGPAYAPVGLRVRIGPQCRSILAAVKRGYKPSPQKRNCAGRTVQSANQSAPCQRLERNRLDFD